MIDTLMAVRKAVIVFIQRTIARVTIVNAGIHIDFKKPYYE
jgi:hypothetical protein